jgi:diguanylate cyclase
MKIGSLPNLLAAVWSRVATPREAGFETSPRDPRALVGANDWLTGLPGLNAFDGMLAQAVRRADARSEQLALLLVNLDDLKSINLTAGRSAGDRILKESAKRLRALVRPFMAARLAGDEFLLLLADDPQPATASALANQVLAAIALPFATERGEMTISCSVGVAMYPEHGAMSTMLSHAQAAMAEAKAAGGASHAVFEARMMRGKREQMEVLRDLRHALELRQLELYYQPKIHAPTGEITGAEALLRWNHPTRGMISPTVFIPMAERYGLILPLGSWVIDEACRQARVWRDQGIRMRVAINLSVHQLRQGNLAEQISAALGRHQINPDLLTCEVTESSAMEDVETTVSVLRQLDRLGVHLSIDDFGTGHSSLSYLRMLPADELKIDRSFVLDLETSDEARTVANAVIQLAKALNLKVVAEGVETEAQSRILRDFGCDQLQGYLFAKPMSAKALALWATDNVGPRAMNFRASIFTETGFQETAPDH